MENEKMTEEKKGAETPAPKKSDGWPITTIAAIVILAVLMLGGAYYWYNLPKEGVPGGMTGGNNTTSALLDTPSARALIKSYELQQNIPAQYTLDYVEKNPDMTEVDARVAYAKDNQYIEVNRSVASRELFYTPNGTIACQNNLDGSRDCADVAADGNASLTQYAEGARSLFLRIATGSADLDKKLIAYGALEFTAQPQQVQYPAGTCTLLAYDINYQNMTDAQFAQLGMDKNDPTMKAFGNFRATKCLDDHYGFAALQTLDYDYLPTNQSQHYARNITEFTTQAAIPDVPVANINQTQLEAQFGMMEGVLSQLDSCVNADSANWDNCLMASAMDFGTPQLCDRSSNASARDACVQNYALRLNQPKICAQAGGSADDCYLNYAYIYKDTSYCSLVKDSAKSESCVQVASQNGTAQNGTMTGDGQMNGTTESNQTMPALT